MRYVLVELAVEFWVGVGHGDDDGGGREWSGGLTSEVRSRAKEMVNKGRTGAYRTSTVCSRPMNVPERKCDHSYGSPKFP